MQVMPLVTPIFRFRYPNVILELTEGGSASLEDRLRKGEIDLALAAIESTSANMTYELIEKETIGILAEAKNGSNQWHYLHSPLYTDT